MTTGLKGWLWFVLVVNAISCVSMVTTAILVPLAWVSVALEILIIAGVSMLLFGRKKMGFYLICGAAVLGLVINVILGVNIIYAVVSAVLMPLITWLLMKNTWYEFQ